MTKRDNEERIEDSLPNGCKIVTTRHKAKDEITGISTSYETLVFPEGYGRSEVWSRRTKNFSEAQAAHAQAIAAYKNKPIKKPLIHVSGDLPAEAVGALVEVATRAIDAEERQPITPERLAEIEGGAARSHDGEICVDYEGYDGLYDYHLEANDRRIASDVINEDTATFFADARQDVLDLLAEVRRAWAGESTALFLAREDKRLAEERWRGALKENSALRGELAAKDSQVALFKDAADVARRNAGIPMRTVLAALARVFPLGFEADGAGPLEPAFRAALEAEGWKDGKRGPRK